MRDHTYTTPAGSRIAYRRAVAETAAPLAAAASEIETRAAGGEALARETFARALGGDRLARTADVPPAWAAAVATAVGAQPAWPALVAASRGSRRAAAAAAAHVLSSVSETLEQALDGARIEDAERLRDEAERVRARAATLAAGDDRDAMEEACASLLAAADKAEVLSAAAAHALADADRRGLLAPVVAAASAAAEAAADAERIAVRFGLSGAGPDGTDEPDADVLAAIAGDEDIKRVLDLAGRMLDALPGGRDGVGRADAGDVVGITTGGDVRRLLPAGRGMLAAGGLAALGVLRDLVDGAALVYEIEDDAPRERGDMVVLVDRSGSMDMCGRSTWARAVALCALTTARRDGRACVVVSFAGESDLDVARLSPTGEGASAAWRAAMRRPGGGTDLDGALRAAMAHVGSLCQPDVLVVTDAETGDVPPGTVSLAREDRRSLTCVRIGTAVAAPWADAIVDVRAHMLTAEAGAAAVAHATR